MDDCKKRKAQKCKAAIEAKENDRIFNSKISLGEKLKELLPDRNLPINKVSKWEQLATSYLTDMGYLPNNNQLAVSIAAVL